MSENNQKTMDQAQMESAIKKQYSIIQKQATDLKKNQIAAVEAISMLVECRGDNSLAHIKRVRKFSTILAQQVMQDYPDFGLTEELVKDISIASMLHDIGKIAIPDSVILKPGELTEEEDEMLKSHTTKGCEILEQINLPLEPNCKKVALEIIRSHHERVDGTGYPDGIKDDEIPLSAQIVSMADQYDVLVSERTYKKAYTKEVAFQMIIEGQCGVFSPQLLDCLHRCREQFEAVIG